MSVIVAVVAVGAGAALAEMAAGVAGEVASDVTVVYWPFGRSTCAS